MPNIMLIGYGYANGEILGKKILRAIHEKYPEIANDAVCTNISDEGTTVFDLENKDRPYIRICSSDSRHFPLILEAIKWAPELKGTKLDIETLDVGFHEVVCCG